MCGALIVAPCPITLSSSWMSQGSWTGSKETRLRRIFICTALVKHIVGSIYIRHGLKNRKQEGSFTSVVRQKCLLVCWLLRFGRRGRFRTCSCCLWAQDWFFLYNAKPLIYTVADNKIKRVLRSMMLKEPSWSWCDQDTPIWNIDTAAWECQGIHNIILKYTFS